MLDINFTPFPNLETERLYLLSVVREDVKEVVKYGFQVLKLHSIEAIIDPDNLASEKVLQKNNFVKQAHLNEYIYYDGRFLDTVIYSILNTH